MSRGSLGFLFLFLMLDTASSALTGEKAYSLYSMNITGASPNIPDPTCKHGIVSADFKACCGKGCHSCGTHALCSAEGKYHEATGMLADSCCKDLVLEQSPSCDKSRPPCVLSKSYRENLVKELPPMPVRHALQDCGKALTKARVNHTRSLDKGHFLATLYVKGESKYKQAKTVAMQVKRKVDSAISNITEVVRQTKAKIADASDNKETRSSGPSIVQKWTDAIEHAEAERVFYLKIDSNADQVIESAETGLRNVHLLREKATKLVSWSEIYPLQLELDTLISHAAVVYRDATELWKQWEDSSKAYDCGAPPPVENSASMCKTGNTRFSAKCNIKCLPGYDGQGTFNTLRCRKQGDFGKELYGEWFGTATCVGRMCGEPPQIDNGNPVVQEVRYPDVATYTCNNGYFDLNGNSAFSMQCGVTGYFIQNASHNCKPIVCGAAPELPHTEPVEGTYKFAETVNYHCLSGYSVDSQPGGLKTFATSCQKSSRFSTAAGCFPITCGRPPSNENAKINPSSLRSDNGHEEHSALDGMFFGDSVSFDCDPGFTLDHKLQGTDMYTLECSSVGEFIVAGTSGNLPLPVCLPVSAGLPPLVQHGTYLRKDMFYGDSAVVHADPGYSMAGLLTDGLTFTFAATKDATFSGLKTFIPVVCGKAPVVLTAKSKFTKEEASFGDTLQYECEKGYSVDGKGTPASASFMIQCEADGRFSPAPGYAGQGSCVNIDDCIGHTCGPYGSCVDHLMNYTCDCASGYELQKDDRGELSCGNIDNCGPEACGVGKCNDLVNDYRCTCPNGYEQVEEAHGNTSDKTCMPVWCGAPPVIDNAGVIPEAATKQAYGMSVSYRCSEGHSTDLHQHCSQGLCAEPHGLVGGNTAFSVDCRADRTFSASATCNPISCNNVPDVKNGKTDSKNALFRQSINFNCDRGYSIDGTDRGATDFSMECQATGAFGGGEECKPVSCGEPRNLPNSFRPSDKMVYGQAVEYDCRNGFSLNGKKDGETKFSVKCEEHAKFSDAQSCQPKSCGAPLSKDVSRIASVKDEGEIRFPSHTEVLCKEGFTVDGRPGGNTSFIVRCLASGEFENFDPENGCKRVLCGTTPAMANSTLKKVISHTGAFLNAPGPRLVFEDAAFYECAEGFTTGGELGAPTVFPVECGSSGVFNPPTVDMQCKNVNDCESHTCGPKGSCVDLIGAAPAYTCSCMAGYEMQVLDNGEKTCGNVDDCKGDCGVGTCTDLIEDYTCECPAGYYVGKSDHDIKTCLPINCAGQAPHLGNGKQIEGSRQKFSFPATVGYECDKGYSVDGTVTEAKRKFQAQCRADGQIYGMTTCQKIVCEAVQVLPFTKLLHPSTSTSLRFDEETKYECQEGYTIKGLSGGETLFTVKCKDNGELTEPEICEAIKCGTAPDVPRSAARMSTPVSYGQQAMYQCDAGHTLNGKVGGDNLFVVDCLKTGDFSELEVDGPCKPISVSPPTINNAYLKLYEGTHVDSLPARVTFNAGLGFWCKPGYSLGGSPSSPKTFSTRVTSTGDFSPSVPSECSQIMYSLHGRIKDARTGEALPGVRVTVTGTTISTVASDGVLSIAQIAAGNATLTYELSGFISVEKHISITDNIADGGAADLSMSPLLSVDQWRAVLKWGARPTDLDSYAKWGANKVCWTNTQQDGRGMSATLEHDDVSSFGPETIHLSEVGACTGGAYYCDIRYYANDYTASNTMLAKGTTATLYTGDRVAGEWNIKDCATSVSSNGNWWHVFTLDGETNKLKWSCSEGASPSANSISFHSMPKGNETQSTRTKKNLRSRHQIDVPKK